MDLESKVSPISVRRGDTIRYGKCGVVLQVTRVFTRCIRVKNTAYGTEYLIRRPWDRYVFVSRAEEIS